MDLSEFGAFNRCIDRDDMGHFDFGTATVLATQWGFTERLI